MNKMVINVGINGFGRIGRVIFRTCLRNSVIEITAINDPALDVEYICYLIKFDSTHGKLTENVTHTEHEINIDGTLIKVFHEKLPSDIPWHTAGVQYVVEASGLFTTLEKASGHLASDGVKRVFVTAPSVDVPMVVMGVNDHVLHSEVKVLSCASSTLYCLAPIVKVLQDNFGVAEGFITSIHAMTPSLKPLDGLCLRGRHWRDYRSIHQNIIPAATGCCKALGKILPQVKDKLTGLALRVPIVNVSVLDVTIRLNTNTSLETIIKCVERASESSVFHKIISISKDEAVSSDFAEDSHSCILDAMSSLQLKPNFYKLICWYENEYSYACRTIDTIFYSEQHLRSFGPISKMTYVRPKLSTNQDVTVQTKSQKIEMCVFLHPEPDRKMLTSTSSQDTGFKNRLVGQFVTLRKPLSSHVSDCLPIAQCRKIKRTSDILKIRNDESNSCNNKNTLIEKSLNCRAEPANEKNVEVCTQDRLEKIKNEFSKMVDLTEDLLMKSQTSRNNTQEPLLHKLTHEASNLKSEMKFKQNEIVDVYSVDGLPSNTVSSISSKINSDYATPETTSTLYNNVGNNDTSVNCSSKARIHSDQTTKIEKDNVSYVYKPPSKEAFKEQVVRTINTLVDGLSHYTPNRREKRTAPCNFIKEMEIISNNVVQDENALELQRKSSHVSVRNLQPHTSSTETISHNKTKLGDSLKSLTKYFNTALTRVKLNDENEIKAHSNAETNENDNTLDLKDENYLTAVEIISKNMDENVSKQMMDSLKKSKPDTAILSTSSKKINMKRKPDIYDKLDSPSGTDSESSFKLDKKKSHIINISDITTSLEDLSRLDKICRIIEISDELSDQLFSNIKTESINTKNEKWSFKDLCEKIKLDEFCNNVFGKGTV